MKQFNGFVLRIFDVLLSGLAIIVLMPLMIPIMVALKLTGEHDIFYRQTRVGKNGKPFRVLKFATMLRDSPNLPGGLITSLDDPRLLPLGKFLRKTKINELPQILNIFIGQMSIVGYRPFAEKHYALYPNEVKECINSIRPGLTGVGSIVFRNEEEILHTISNRDHFHDEIITPYKGKLECWYVKHRTLKNYMLVILCTTLVVLNGKNGLWKRIFKYVPEIPEDLKPYLG